MSNRSSLAVGQRIEIPAYLDQWMRGDRYGVISGYPRQRDPHSPPVVRIRLDKSRDNIIVRVDELKGGS